MAIQGRFFTAVENSEQFSAQLQEDGNLTGKFELDMMVPAFVIVASSPSQPTSVVAGVGMEPLDPEIEVSPVNVAPPTGSESETEPTAKAGVVLPLGFVSAYAGFQYSVDVL